MRVEIRFGGEEKQLLLLPTKEESLLIDKIFGHRVGDDDVIAKVKGVVKLSDGYEAHYIRLERET